MGCGYYDVTLTVGERKVRKEYIGAPQWNTEETLHYEYSMGVFKKLPEHELLALKWIVLMGGIKAPGVNMVDEIIRKELAKLQRP